MKNAALSLCVLVVALAVAPRARACASCMCGSTAPIAPGLDVPFPGRLRVGLLVDGASVEDAYNVVLAGQARVGLWWAPAPSLVLDAALPVGARARLDGEDAHVNGRAAHLGDATVGVRLVWFRDRLFGPRHIGSVRVSLTAPTAPEVGATTRAGKVAAPLSPELQPGRGAFLPRAELTWLSVPVPSLQVLGTAAVEAPVLSLRALTPAASAEAAAVLQWTPQPAGGGMRAGLRLGTSGRLTGAERRGERVAPAGQRGSWFALAGVVWEPMQDVLVVWDVGVPVWSTPLGGGVARDRAIASVGVIGDLPPLSL